MIDEIYSKPITQWPEMIVAIVEELLSRLDSFYDKEVNSYVRREVARRLTTVAPDAANHAGNRNEIHHPDCGCFECLMKYSPRG